VLFSEASIIPRKNIDDFSSKFKRILRGCKLYDEELSLRSFDFLSILIGGKYLS